MVRKNMKELVTSREDKININGKRSLESQDKGVTKRIKTKSLYRQPTVNEINRLHETENLFNSNLFRLQIEEVLQEVKIKEKTLTRFKEWFTQFKSDLLCMPQNNNEFDLTEKTLVKELKVKLPVGGHLSSLRCSYKFHKFTNVEIVGSYALNAAINSNLNVDVEIIVPADTYTKNDSINYRYHKKRAAYLSCIASYVRKLDCVEDLKYSWLNGNECKSFLLVTPKGNLGKHVVVRILLSCEEEAFKLHRYSPNRNNLRESWLLNDDNNGEDSQHPSPYYNSSVLADLTSSRNNKFLHKVLGDGVNLKHAIMLVKIWLKQRSIKMSGFIVSMFVAYLVQIKRVNSIMSSYQIVRNFWIALKTSEWDTKGISLNKDKVPAPSVEEFLQHFPVVFVDGTGYYNICWQMDIGTYNALRRESTIAVDMLDNHNINNFMPLFMTPFKPILQFDHILRFKDVNMVKEAVYKNATVEDKLNYGMDSLALVTKNVYNILSKGLGKRVSLIVQQTESDFSWGVKEKYDKAKLKYKEELSFGFILNPEYCLDVIDKGPAANMPEAEQFRAFWGGKSELRRFQDGSITETCVWDGESLADRRMVTKQIVEYLLKLKFGLSTELFYIADQLDSVLTRKEYASADGVIGTGEENTVQVIKAFDELRQDLRALTDLPLDINSVYGISPVFSYCDPFPSQAKGLGAMNPWKRGASCLIKDEGGNDDIVKCPPYVPVSTAVLELGYSGKWPGDLEAFRCLKAAFHLQIAQSLTKQFSLPTQAHPAHIDLLKSGLVFRLEIAHPKEVTLLMREVDKGVVRHKESNESVLLQCRSLLLPRLRGAMHGLQLKYPAFGPTTVLLKRLLSSHLIDDSHFPHTVLELIVASVFLRPEPFTAPSQPLNAFVRVLNLLCSKDWNSEALIVNFNEELNREDIMKSEKKHSESESEMPTIFIITPYDGDMTSIWSREAPTVQVLSRVQLLAKSTLGFMEQSLLEETRENILGVFLPSLVGYDVIIHLYPHLVPYVGERVEKQPQLRQLPAIDEVDAIIPVVEFNPVAKYLNELRSAYGTFALFFNDMYGGEVITVLWKPDVEDIKEFETVSMQALQPKNVNDEVKYEVNLDAIIEDFRILGKGLVKNVTVNM